MKALILAGGKGSRLRPLTYTSAKQLIPVANKPIVFYGIEALQDAGISDFGVVVGDTADEVIAGIGDGSRWGVRVTYIRQDQPLGLAHAVATAADWLGDEPFVLFLGDNLVRDGVTPFVERFRASTPNALILLSRVPDPQRFGVAELQDGRVVRLVEKPPVPASDLALVGVYLFDHHILRAVREITPSARGELEITDAIQWLVDHGYTVEPHLVQGWWKDTGKPEDVLDANRLVLETLEPANEGDVAPDSDVRGRVSIGAGSVVRGSVIRGPAVIGCDCRIENAYVGPFTALGDGVVVRNAEVENSVLMPGARLLDVGVRIDGSLLGRNVEVTRTPERPRALQLVLGDNSQAKVG